MANIHQFLLDLDPEYKDLTPDEQERFLRRRDLVAQAVAEVAPEFKALPVSEFQKKLDELYQGESLLTAAPKSVAQGVVDTAGGVGGLLQMGEEILGTGTEYGKTSRQAMRDLADSIQPEMVPGSWSDWISQTGRVAGNQIIPQILGVGVASRLGRLADPTSVLARNISLGGMGGQATGQKFGEVRDRQERGELPGGVGRAAGAGVLSGAIETATEFLPTEALFRGTGLIDRFLKTTAADVPGELLSNVGGEAVARNIEGIPEREYTPYLEQAFDRKTAFISLLSSGGMSAAHAAAGRFTRPQQVDAFQSILNNAATALSNDATPEEIDAYLAEQINSGVIPGDMRGRMKQALVMAREQLKAAAPAITEQITLEDTRAAILNGEKNLAVKELDAINDEDTRNRLVLDLQDLDQGDDTISVLESKKVLEKDPAVVGALTKAIEQIKGFRSRSVDLLSKVAGQNAKLDQEGADRLGMFLESYGATADDVSQIVGRPVTALTDLTLEESDKVENFLADLGESQQPPADVPEGQPVADAGLNVLADRDETRQLEDMYAEENALRQMQALEDLGRQRDDEALGAMEQVETGRPKLADLTTRLEGARGRLDQGQANQVETLERGRSIYQFFRQAPDGTDLDDQAKREALGDFISLPRPVQSQILQEAHGVSATQASKIMNRLYQQANETRSPVDQVPARSRAEPAILEDTEASEPTPQTESVLVSKPVVGVSRGSIAVKPELMQFKKIEAADSGINERDKLAGQWDDVKAGTLLLWEPANPKEHGLKDGQRYILVNGHHRMEFGDRSGVPSYNAQIIRESEGFSASDARAYGAEVNIADGKGDIYEQVRFLRGQAEMAGKDAALERGRQIGARGRKAAAIAFQAGDNLYNAFVNEVLRPGNSEENGAIAAAIAEAAPNDEALQRVGIRHAERRATAEEIRNLIEAARQREAAAKSAGQQFDLFGQDDSALEEDKKNADAAMAIQREIRNDIAAISGAAKRPEVAKKYGVNVKDRGAVQKKVQQLRELLDRWDRWASDKELVSQVRERVKEQESQPSTGLGRRGMAVNPGDVGVLAAKWAKQGLSSAWQYAREISGRVKSYLEFGKELIKKFGRGIQRQIKALWDDAQQWLRLNKIMSRRGVFSGRNAVGFDQAEKEGRVFRGKYDNLPRFEIDDTEATINTVALTPHSDRFNDAVKAHRKLKELNANNVFEGRERDYAASVLDAFYRNMGFGYDGRNANRDEKIALRDAFESGDRNKLPSPLAADSQRLKMSELFQHEELYRNYPELKNVPVYVNIDPEKKNSRRGEFNPSKNMISITVSSIDELKQVLVHEIQHYIQEREGFAIGGSPEIVPYLLRAKAQSLRQQARKMFDESSRNDPLARPEVLKPGLRKRGFELEKQAQELESRANLADYSAFGEYLNIAGEIEARDVAARSQGTTTMLKKFRKAAELWRSIYPAEYDRLFDKLASEDLSAEEMARLESLEPSREAHKGLWSQLRGMGFPESVATIQALKENDPSRLKLNPYSSENIPESRAIVAFSSPGSEMSQSINDELVKEKLDEYMSRMKASGVNVFTSLNSTGDIVLDRIVIEKQSRGQGIGSSAVLDLLRIAEESGRRVLLSPSTDFGASSVSRLKAFYSRFGFVENKGRKKDFTTRETMIWTPPAMRGKSSVKGAINEITGVTRLDEPTITERQAEKRALQREAAVGRSAAAVGRREATEKMRGEMKERIQKVWDYLRSREMTRQQFRKEAGEMVRKLLPAEERGKLIPAILAADTKGKFEKILRRIENVIAEVEQREALENMRDALSMVTDKKLQALRPEFRQEAAKIAVEFADFYRPSKFGAYDGPFFRDLVKYLTEEAGDTENPVELLKKLSAIDRKNIREMSADDLNTAADAIKTLVHLNRTKNRLLSSQLQKTVKQTAEQIAADVTKEFPDVLEDGTTKDGGEKTPDVGFLGKYGYALLKPENLIDRLGDAGRRLIWEPIRAGRSKALEMSFRGKDIVRRAFASAGLTSDDARAAWLSELVPITSGAEYVIAPDGKVSFTPGKTVWVTRGQRMDLLGHVTSNDTRQELLRSGFVFAGNKAGTTNRFTQKDIEALQATASPEEKKIVEAMKRYLNGQAKKSVNETALTLEGREIAFLPDYWPRSREINRKDVAATVNVEANLENMGFTKERVANRNPVKLADAAVKFDRHIDQVGAFVGLAIPLRDVRHVMTARLSDQNLTLEKVLMRHLGASLTKAIDNMLLAFSEQAQGYNRSSEMESAVKKVLSNISVGHLGLRPWSALKQMAGIPAMLSEADSVEIAAALPALGRSTKSFQAKIRKYSPILRERYEGSALGLVQPEWGMSKDWREKLMFMLRDMDMRVSAVAWQIAENRIEKSDPNLSGSAFYEKAAREAERIISRTQNATDITDFSNLAISSRGRAFEQALLMFSSPGNAVVNQFDTLMRRRKQGKISAGKMLGTMAGMTVGIAVVTQSINALVRAIKGRDDDEKMKTAVVDAIYDVFGNFYGIDKALPILRRVVSQMVKGKDVNPDDLEFGSAPVMSDIANAMKALVMISQSMYQAYSNAEYKGGERRGEEKWVTSGLKALNLINKGVLPLAGLPSAPGDLFLPRLVAPARKSEGEKAFDRIKELRRGMAGDEEGRAKSDAIAAWKRARKSSDQEAAKAAYQEYLNAGGTGSSFRQAVRDSGPLGGLSPRKRAEILKGLSAEDRDALRKAEDWHQEATRGF